MICFINSEERLLINNYLNKLKGNQKKIEFSVKENDLLEIANELLYVDMFDNNNFFVINEVDFFSVEKPKISANKINSFVDALNVTHYDVFICVNKPIKENAYIKRLKVEYQEVNFDNVEEQYQNLINELINEKEIEITSTCLEKLKYNLNNDYYAIISELIKLSTYDRKITDAIIDELSYKTREALVFDVATYVFKNEYEKVDSLYQDLLETNNAISLLAVFASQLHFAYAVKLLEGRSNEEIARILNAKVYRVKVTSNQVMKMKKLRLERMYIRVGEMDYLAKQGRYNMDNFVHDIINV